MGQVFSRCCPGRHGAGDIAESSNEAKGKRNARNKYSLDGDVNETETRANNNEATSTELQFTDIGGASIGDELKSASGGAKGSPISNGEYVNSNNDDIDGDISSQNKLTTQGKLSAQEGNHKQDQIELEFKRFVSDEGVDDESDNDLPAKANTITAVIQNHKHTVEINESDKKDVTSSESDTDSDRENKSKNLVPEPQPGKRLYIKNSASSGMLKEKTSSKPDKEKHAMVNHAFDGSDEDRPVSGMGLTNPAFSGSSDESSDEGGIQILSKTTQSKEQTKSETVDSGEIETVDSGGVDFELSEDVSLTDKNSCNISGASNSSDESAPCNEESKPSVINSTQATEATNLPSNLSPKEQQNIDLENKMIEDKGNSERRHSLLQIGRRGEYVESTLVLADPDDVQTESKSKLVSKLDTDPDNSKTDNDSKPLNKSGTGNNDLKTGSKSKPVSMYDLADDSDSESDEELEVYHYNGGNNHQSGTKIKGDSGNNIEENREWGSLQYPLDATTYAIPYGAKEQVSNKDGRSRKQEQNGIAGPEENREWGSLQFPTDDLIDNRILSKTKLTTQATDSKGQDNPQVTNGQKEETPRDSDGLEELCIDDLPKEGSFLSDHESIMDMDEKSDEKIKSIELKKQEIDSKEKELWLAVEKSEPKKSVQNQEKIDVSIAEKKNKSIEDTQDVEDKKNESIQKTQAIDSDEDISISTIDGKEGINENNASGKEVKRRLSLNLMDDLSDLTSDFEEMSASAKREKFKHSVEYSMDSVDMNFKLERLEANLGLLVSEPEKDEESLILVLQILDEICEYRDLLTGIESAREENLPPEITKLRADLIASGQFTEIEIDENYKDDVTELNDTTARKFIVPHIDDSQVRAILQEHSQKHAELQRRRKQERQDFLSKLEAKLKETKSRNLRKSLNKIEELSENDSQDNEPFVQKVLIAREEVMGDIQLHSRESESIKTVETPTKEEVTGDVQTHNQESQGNYAVATPIEDNQNEAVGQKTKIKAMFSFNADSDDSDAKSEGKNEMKKGGDNSDSDSENKDDAKDENDIRSMYAGLVQRKDSDSDSSSFPSSIIDQLSLDEDTADEESEKDEDDNVKTMRLSLQASLTEDIKENMHSMTADDFKELMTIYRLEQEKLGNIQADEKSRLNQSLWNRISEHKRKTRADGMERGDAEGCEETSGINGKVQDVSTQLENKKVNETGTSTEDKEVRETGTSMEGKVSTRDIGVDVMEMYEETDRKYEKVATVMDDQFIKSVLDSKKENHVNEDVSKLLQEHLDEMGNLRKIKETEVMDHHVKMIKKLQERLQERRNKEENKNGNSESMSDTSSSDSELDFDDWQFEEDFEKLKKLTLEEFDSRKVTISQEDLEKLLSEYQRKQKALVERRRKEKQTLNEKLKEKLAQKEKKERKLENELTEQENTMATTVNEMDSAFYQSLANRFSQGNITEDQLKKLVAQHLDEVELFRSRVQEEMVRQRQQRNQDKKIIVGQEDFTNLINRQKEQSIQLKKMRQGERENINNKLKEKLETHKKKEKIKPARLLLDSDEDSDLENNSVQKRSTSRPVYENVEISL